MRGVWLNKPRGEVKGGGKGGRNGGGKRVSTGEGLAREWSVPLPLTGSVFTNASAGNRTFYHLSQAVRQCSGEEQIALPVE